MAAGDVSVVEVSFPVPDDEGIFELALDLFEERGQSLTGLGAASVCARVKVTRHATPIREFFRSNFRRGQQVVA